MAAFEMWSFGRGSTGCNAPCEGARRASESKMPKVSKTMDTMETTKIVGGACGALLIYLLLNWAGETLYHVGSDAHGEDHAAASPASIWASEDVPAGAASASEGPSIEELLASADVEKGAKVFSKCKACHKLGDGENGTGPHLFNIVDRAQTSIDGFNYSAAFKGLTGNWDAAALDGFLTKPSKYTPGTKMSFAGLKKATDRANLIAYLAQIK